MSKNLTRRALYELDVDFGRAFRGHRRAEVRTPAVSKLRHEILSGSWPSNVQGMALAMQQEASARALEQGPRIASEPAVVALCEKQLIAFLSGFLAQQQGVKAVPQITIKYKPSAP